MKKFLSVLMVMMLLAAPALAESVTLEGTVVSTQNKAVLASAAGTVSEVLAQAGERVAAGDAIATLAVQTVYAEENGVVTVYGGKGEATETVANRNGAVVYLETECKYIISASTKNAYDAIENKIIHLGETVYLRCTNNNDHKGVGFVTAIDGTSFTVEVTEGEFVDGESVYIYRDADYTSSKRIGRGTADYQDLIAYTGSGTLTDVYVENGMYVTAGTALFSTLEAGAYTQEMAGGVNGIVAGVSVNPGDAVEQGALIATIYPDSAMRLAIQADEYDLRKIKLGAPVQLNFASGVSVAGVVERIAGVQYTPAETDEEETDDTVYFQVYISFEPNAYIAYGMTAKVTFE